MDRGDNPSAVTCKLCGEAFILPEEEVDGNLPRVLLCAHIYCTACLLSIQCDNVIRCPDCEVESTLPEGGVFGLQEDSRIIGLIYTSKMNKMKRCDRSKNRKRNTISPSTDKNVNTEDVVPADIEKESKTVDEALARGAENLALLEHIHKTLTTGLEEQVNRDRARLEIEIKQAADKALCDIQKWKDLQLGWLNKLEARFSTSQAEVWRVKERMKALKIAMQMAREVRRVPFLEQYCTLDKVLETLQASVDDQSFNVKCITMGSGMSCVFLSESVNQSLSLSLKMEVGSPRKLSESPPKGPQLSNSNRRPNPRQPAKSRNRNCSSPTNKKPPSPQKREQHSPGASRLLRGSSSSPTLLRRSGLSCDSSTSDLNTADVIIEELSIQGLENALPPTGPELANDKWRIHRRQKNQSFVKKRNDTQWVVVTRIVNPSHFYVRYVAEKKDSEILSKKINQICSRESFRFTTRDTVETGSRIFVKWEGLWCRASVVEVMQNGCVEAIKACPVTELASVRVFCLDYGFTKSFTIQREEETTESSLGAVNNHLRKVGEGGDVLLSQFPPQAIRCSLKDLVPYDLTKGWSKEAQVQFQSLVGSAAVEMRSLGQDSDSLLVDLKKAPMDQSSDVPISVREFLVFIEVARFYSPVKLDRKPLLFYPPEYPMINAELNAVVSHINSPADFYIQLIDNMESLLLSAKLQDCYNTRKVAGEDDLNIYCPMIEQACVARYEDKWYRAQVIGHPGGGKVEVQYVDFGNKKILSVCDLRKIKDEFFALPAKAIHSCLSDVIPLDGKTWSDACINRFISLAQQKPVTIVATGRVPKTEPLPVKLFESSLNGPQADIAELLVKEELASFKEGLSPSCSVKPRDTGPPGDDSAIWDPPLDALDQTIPGDQDEKLLEFQPQLELPSQLKDLKVRVSHVNSPSSFYVQLIQHDSQLRRMCELVKKECALMKLEDVAWKADMYCAAQINGVWERGQICSDVTSSNIAEVMRCDHGNTVKLHVSNLRPLPLSLTGSLALECTLTDIRPAGGRSTWTATACDLISYYLTRASAVMTIKELTDERPVPVTLFRSNEMGQFVSIADFLLSEGLALRERKPRDAVIQKPKETEVQSPMSETQSDVSDGEKKNSSPASSVIPSPFQTPLVSTPNHPKPAPRTIMSAEKVKTELYCPPELPCLGHIQINVSAIGEDGVIYARTHSAECQLETLRERIQHCLKTLPKQKAYTWKSVQGCAVIGPDMSWYRGQLLEVLGGHVKVQYVDYGLVEIIPVVHVYPMLVCDDVPQLCMPCQLQNIIPVGGRWQQDAVALLRELLLNRSVDMKVMNLPTDLRGPLTVELFLDGLSLSKILCHHEHASMDLVVPSQKGHLVKSPAIFLDKWDINIEGLMGPEEPILGPFMYPNLPQEGEEFQVRVKHLLTPNELFLWPLEGTADVEVEGETLDEALTRINTNINSLQPLTNFPNGGPCLAEYSDGKYYRAKLLKFTSVEPVMILVQHVDFGSHDTLPTSKLRQMPAELLQFPSRALKVKVAGFKAPRVNRQEDMLPYSPGWSVKATMDMIDMLHGNITASVTAQEPELTVLLYNEDKELVHLPLVSSGLAEFD
ncbi:RING finger protein 17 isoform X2 [Centropristis striata]|uniref:RING finger protein 17 isoform X2 n=1 Tax=Centropristis striata TaxID=184440 RepID=UPI0027DECDF7|nr:RING finger protein 17 isoform X2 [Centropristis striata]